MGNAAADMTPESKNKGAEALDNLRLFVIFTLVYRGFASII